MRSGVVGVRRRPSPRPSPGVPGEGERRGAGACVRAYSLAVAWGWRIFSRTLVILVVSSGDLNSLVIFVAARGSMARRYWIIVSSLRVIKMDLTCLAGMEV